MSAQWEVVGKSNKKVNIPTKKLTKTEKKKFVENAPKIEDVLPLDQIRTLYNALDGNKENKKPQATNTKDVEKKPKKKAPVTDKKEQSVKEKVTIPKSLDAAAKLLDVKELRSVVELNQTRFPDAPLLWLKGLAEYLNVRLTHTGSMPLPRAKDTFTSSLSTEARDVLQKAVQQSGPAVMQYSFEHCLTAMVNELSKGNSSVVGFKILLQLVASQSAAPTLANPSKVQALWNSYQNKQPIGLTILWALGQLGIKDISIGLTVWQDLMLPMLDMRNYSSFVVSYLKDLSSLNPRGKPPGTDQLLAVLDIVYSPKQNVPTALRKDMQDAISLLLKRALEYKPESRLRLFFQPLLERLRTATPKSLEKEFLASLVLCLKSDVKCYSLWQQIYSKHTTASASLLLYLRNEQWKDLNAELLRETLLTFQTTNLEILQGKQRNESVKQCQEICEGLLPKLKIQMKVTAKSFPWRFGSFLVVLAIAGLLTFDVQRHGSFESSSTGLFLRDVGVLKYSKQAWIQTKFYSSKGATWAAENVPIYYQILSEKSRPYLHQAKEVTLVAGTYLNQTCWNLVSYAQDKAPVVEAWVDQYAPGLMKQIQNQSTRVWGLARESALWLGEVSVQQSHIVFDWARTNVFVGSLSPEKLQQFSQEAINTTQEYAFWTYQWVVEKYHTLATVQ